MPVFQSLLACIIVSSAAGFQLSGYGVRSLAPHRAPVQDGHANFANFLMQEDAAPEPEAAAEAAAAPEPETVL